MNKTWHAKWICHPQSAAHVDPTPFWEEGERNVYYLFRKEFDWNGPATGTTIRLSGSTWYRFYINETFIDQGPLQSAPFYKYYNKIDISPHLKQGRNSLAIELHITGKSYQGGLLLEIDRTDDGPVVVSDGDWRTIRGTAWHEHVRFNASSLYCPWSEILDLRQLPQGWKSTGFDDSQWQPATVLRNQRGDDQPPAVPPWLYLVERDIPYFHTRIHRPVHIHSLEEHDYVCTTGNPADLTTTLSAAGSPLQTARITNPQALLENGQGDCSLQTGTAHPTGFADGIRAPSITLDFGKIIRGYVELELEGPAGARLEIGYTENLVNGRFNNALTCPFADAIILREGLNTYRSFCWKSFRYIKLFATECARREIRIHSFHAACEQYPFQSGTAFSCTDRQISSIYNLCEWTIDLCTADAIFDTPCREQGQWMYDVSGAILNGLLYAFGETRMPRKFLRQAVQGLLPTGTAPYLSNAWYPDWKAYTDSSLWYFHALWNYYLFSGDGDLLDELHPRLCLMMEFYTRRIGPDGILTAIPNTFLDWGYDAAAGKYNGKIDARIGRSAALNALFYWSLERFEAMCERYGDTKRKAEASRCRAALKTAFATTFWNHDKGCLADAVLNNNQPSAQVSEYANALAILAGLPTPRQVATIVETLFEKKTTPGIEAAPFASLYILKALDKAARFDLAMKILRQRWGERWADKGWTSAGENWAIHFHNGNYAKIHSQSHAWSAGPCEFLTGNLLGLQILEPGFNKIRLDPRPPGFDCAVTLHTPQGTLSATYRNSLWKIQSPPRIQVIPL